MSDITELIYGKEYSDASDAFDAEINSLDKKYPDVLDKDDKFINHVVLTTNIVGKGVVTFAIIDEDKIPQYIQKEMNEIFHRHFGSSK